MNINVDLKLQLFEYLYNNFQVAWFKLLQVNYSDIDLHLYILRKHRYILSLTENEKYNNLLNSVYLNYNKELIHSAEYGYLQILKYLITNKDFNNNNDILDSNTYILLQYVMRYNYLDILEYLMTINLESFKIEHYDYIFTNAALRDYSYIIQHIINRLGIDQVQKFYQLDTKDNILYKLAANGKLKVIKYLINQGLVIHNYINIMLQRAAQFGHLKTFRYLLNVKDITLNKHML